MQISELCVLVHHLLIDLATLLGVCETFTMSKAKAMYWLNLCHSLSDPGACVVMRLEEYRTY